MASAPKIGHNNKLILILLSVVGIGVVVGVGLYGYDLHRQSVERQRADRQANDDLLSKVKDENIRTEWETFMTERGTERTTQDTKLYSWVSQARGETQDLRQLESDLFDKNWGVTDDYLRKLADLGMTVDQAKAQMAKDGITDPSLPADWYPR